MRHLALGRLQVAADIRVDLDQRLVDAMRGAHRLGASITELCIESGIPEQTIRRVVKGGSL